MFHELTKDEVTQIVDLMIARVQRQLESQGLGLEPRRRPSTCWPTRATTPASGHDRCAGPSSAVEDPVSEKLLLKEVRAGEIVVVDAQDDLETGERVIVFRRRGLRPGGRAGAAAGTPPVES